MRWRGGSFGARTRGRAATKRTAEVGPRWARGVILAVIGLAMVVVALAVVLQDLAKPEKRVRRQIEEIAAEYYEDYFYTPVAEAAQVPMSEVLEKYTQTGLSQVSFTQLLHYGEEKHPGATALVTKYCDEDASVAVFYPEEPFGKTDYHTEFGFRCEF